MIPTLRISKIALAFVLCLSGCATFPSITGPITGKKYNVDWSAWGGYDYPESLYKEIREAYVQNHPDLPKETKDAILNKKIRPGMTAEQVKISWGPPRYVDSQITTAWGHSEIWHYQGLWVWMVDEKVDAIQNVSY